jgi:uncharacterized protein (TIGR02145 family)
MSTSGWNGLYGGYRNSTGTFAGLGTSARWWSSTPSSINAWYRALYSSYAYVNRSTANQAYGWSVRCLRN